MRKLSLGQGENQSCVWERSRTLDGEKEMMSNEGKRAWLRPEWYGIRVATSWDLRGERGGNQRWVQLLLPRSSARSPLSLLPAHREARKGSRVGVRLRRAEREFDKIRILPFPSGFPETLHPRPPPPPPVYFRFSVKGIGERPLG